jgi:hypothetical protein
MIGTALPVEANSGHIATDMEFVNGRKIFRSVINLSLPAFVRGQNCLQ